MSGRDRFLSALAGRAVAFAPIVWEELPALVHQERADWWRDPTVGQRLIGDAAALAGADAMFVFVAAEVVRRAVPDGERGRRGARRAVSVASVPRGRRARARLREVAPHAVIAAVPAPATLQRALSGEESEAAEDAFTDLVSAPCEAGADAVAVTGEEAARSAPAWSARCGSAELFGRRLYSAVCRASTGNDGLGRRRASRSA